MTFGLCEFGTFNKKCEENLEMWRNNRIFAA